MAVAPMPLTDAAIRAAKPGPKPTRHFDSGGLYLEVSPTGGKWWRFKYRFGGKEKRLSLGVYPAVPLVGHRDKRACEWIEGERDKRDKARRLLANGIDPAFHRKATKAASGEQADSFEVVAREWIVRFAPRWVLSHQQKMKAPIKTTDNERAVAFLERHFSNRTPAAILGKKFRQMTQQSRA